jgi:hypothetical protein
MEDIWIGRKKDDNEGHHNADLEKSQDRLIRGKTYKDLSTICIVPTRGVIPARVVQSWMGLMAPMNQKFLRIFIEKMEVGEAYNHGIEQILAHPELSTWKYVLTLEEDNCPPPDGLLKLYESMDKFDVVEGLYWTKGEGGQPMCYGNPAVMPRNYIPQLPPIDQVKEYNGLGMGFNLWKLDMFRKVEKPWFKTVQEYRAGEGVKACTQDMFFFDKAAKHGFKFACDGRVKVGHYDYQTDTMW